MPRAARIDIPGLLQHVIVRGIEKRDIFVDDGDKSDLLCRMSGLLDKTQTDCFAWAFLNNHFHLLLRPRVHKLDHFMRRLLTGYAVAFNLRHNRTGYLFQNRFKSIVCDQDAYLLELIRYIHLNPLRAGIVASVDELDRYPWCGHVHFIAGRWFDQRVLRESLRLFSASPAEAVEAYRQFILDGIQCGGIGDLAGGGKLRSLALDPTLNDEDLFDERILGGGAFVERFLGATSDKLQNLPSVDIPMLIQHVAQYHDIAPATLSEPDRNREKGRIKGILCYVALRKFGFSGKEVAAALNMTPAGVSVAARRGEKVLSENPRVLEDLTTGLVS